MHSVSLQRWWPPAAPIHIVGTILMLSVFAYISHIPESSCYKGPHHMWHAVKKFLCILYAPTFGTHVKWPVHEHTYLLRVQTCLHMHFALPKRWQSLAARTPLLCICWNRSNAFCTSPHFTYPIIMEYQETTSCNDIPLNTLLASSMLPHLAYMSMRLLRFHTHNPFEYSLHGCICPLQALVN